ncbi:hypothetical protein [Mycobacterium gordonae]|uniref:Uncharacterized protein n=1 Tax=Mycobacterium gordonae TaxID=1778 RepID=A0A1X1W0E0_MYCGO|nr:hypothetical protein [Mycobacterium gordonae]MCV7010134.1 hypothetical protein [Mycobacterium gordonae]ODR22829.1 hypothetical protein BHQ23_07200 [Mycobacterium gordonae]ORV78235.1 hypothetical protein AWC08_31795 [Mycobacterium gordonae]PJE10740.1 MAG: hypothetical protein CK429_18455 [Mycobacterium sp.]
MDIVVAVILILTLIVAAAVAVVAVVNRRQQRALTDANQLLPGRPTRAPRSWAVSHDPEARLHRRLRDAMKALYAVNAVDTGTTIVLRADLEQTALDLDDHLVAVAQLAPNHRGELLATITTTVESIEAAVARYATAATMPDATTLESDLATVQRHLDVTREVQRRLTA